MWKMIIAPDILRSISVSNKKTDMCICVCVQDPYKVGTLQSPYREGVYKAHIQEGLCEAPREGTLWSPFTRDFAKLLGLHRPSVQKGIG